MDNWNGIVSLFIACIEMILVVNLIILAPKNKVNNSVIILITLLFVYQLLEFLMCYLGLTASTIAYLAFVDISFLPPLSLFMVMSLLDYPASKFSALIFLPAILFTFYYALVIPQFQVVACTVLYASFNYPLGTLYGFFYYLPILISMVLLVMHIIKSPGNKKSFLSKVVLTGYIIISLPVIIAFILSAAGNTELLQVIESIMCKFAVVLAVCLGFVSLYGRTPASPKNSTAGKD